MRYLLFIIPFFFILKVGAQTIVKQDAAIKIMVDEVSSKNIEANIRKLVSFKTRHTLSDTTSQTEGSGAARNWIKAEMEKYASASSGRMKVQFDTFTQPRGDRIDKPVKLKRFGCVERYRSKRYPDLYCIRPLRFAYYRCNGGKWC